VVRSQNILTWARTQLLPKSEENWKIITLCVFGAMVFWFFNALNKEYNTRIDYPVRFNLPQEDIVVVTDLPDEIRLELSGGGWNLLRKTFWFTIDPIVVTLENPTEVKYLTTNDIRETVTDHFAELQINSILTDTLYLNIEPRISKRVPVAIDSLRIQMDDSYRIVSEISLTVDSVELSGPSSLINSLTDTFYISLQNTKINKNLDSKIDLKPFVSPLVSVYPSELRISFDVDEFVHIDKAVRLTPVNFPEDANLRLADSIITIEFNAPQNRLEDLGNEQFRMLLDYSDLSEDSTITPKLVAYPSYIEKVFFDTVKIQLEKLP